MYAFKVHKNYLMGNGEMGNGDMGNGKMGNGEVACHRPCPC